MTLSDKNEVVAIGDRNLEKALQEILGEPITVERLERLEDFDNWNEYRADAKPDWQPIRDISPLKHCRYLKNISADGNEIEDISPLESIETLEELWLDGNPINDLTPLANKSNLRILVVENNKRLTDIEPLSGMPKLEYLNISDTAVEDLSVLKTLPHLKIAALYGLEDQVWKDRANYRVVEELLQRGIKVKMRELEVIQSDILTESPPIRDDMPLEEKLRALGAFRILMLIREKDIAGQLNGDWEGKGLSALHLAVKNAESGEDPVTDRVKLVQILIEANAPTDRVNNDGLPPLHYFLEENPAPDLRMLECLLGGGFPVNQPVQGYKTPLFIAIQAVEESRAAVDMLIQNGADIMSPDVLYAAAEKGLDDLVMTALDAGMDINCVESGSGRNLLFSLSLDAAQARRLLELGIDFRRRDHHGRTALFPAVEYSSPEVVRLLLDNGCDVNARDENGDTPLHYVKDSLVRHKESLAIIPLLVENGADINALNRNGQSPLDRANADSLCAQLKRLGAKPGSEL